MNPAPAGAAKSKRNAASLGNTKSFWIPASAGMSAPVKARYQHGGMRRRACSFVAKSETRPARWDWRVKRCRSASRGWMRNVGKVLRDKRGVEVCPAHRTKGRCAIKPRSRFTGYAVPERPCAGLGHPAPMSRQCTKNWAVARRVRAAHASEDIKMLQKFGAASVPASPPCAPLPVSCHLGLETRPFSLDKKRQKE